MSYEIRPVGRPVKEVPVKHIMRAASCAFALALLMGSVATPVSAVETHVVLVQDGGFSPSELQVRKGDMVRWEWVSGTHTITSGLSPDDREAGSRFEAVVNAEAAVFEFTFTEVGVVDYFSRPQWETVKGKITVLDATLPVDRQTWGRLKALFENPAAGRR